jgi:3-methyl-2-oxobutanoate hydroxymethyltransferase
VRSILELARAKREHRPIVMVTAYDAVTARTLQEAGVDVLLVGDSAAMVVHGFPSTIHATVEMMELHTAAVRRGAPGALIVADMPFLSVRRGLSDAVSAAGRLMRAGADAVKIEGLAGQADIIAHLIGSGIPVMGHLGLTPQSVHQLGGHRVQGRTAAAAERLAADAAELERLGAFALVLECVPAALASRIARERTSPTIGIGAGKGTDGQVLVVNDLLGLDPSFQPSFVRRYGDGHGLTLKAVRRFARDVRQRRFPAPKEVPA